MVTNEGWGFRSDGGFRLVEERQTPPLGSGPLLSPPVLGPSDSTLKSVALFLLRPGAETLPPASQFVCMQQIEGLPGLQICTSRSPWIGVDGRACLSVLGECV